jgi:hypothetical protein
MRSLIACPQPQNDGKNKLDAFGFEAALKVSAASLRAGHAVLKLQR